MNPKICEKCGWDFEANKETCPNCIAPTIIIEGVCEKDCRIEQILYHPVKHPLSLEGTFLTCQNCGGNTFKDIKITIKK